MAVTVTLSGSAVVLAVASAPGAFAASPAWAIQATPNPDTTSSSILTAVSCPSTTACTAVGYNMPPSNPLNPGYSAFAELWDGTTWKIVPPSRPSPTVSLLNAVSCASATDCMAVGYYTGPGNIVFPLAERWNGTSWTVMPPPFPAGSPNTELTGVSCPSAKVCVAVGFSKNSTTNSLQDLAEFWDGRGLFNIHPHWTIQPTQGTFSEVNYPLNAVSCSPTTNRLGIPTDCLAVGSYVSPFSSTPYSYYTWSEHWDGASWSGVLPDAPSNIYNDLLGVSCPAATACTAVGVLKDPSGMDFPLAEGWNGTTWTLQAPEFPITRRAPCWASVVQFSDGLHGGWLGHPAVRQ